MAQEKWEYDLSPAPEIRIGDFAKVDARVGRVVEVEEYPEARKPSYKLRIDFGPLGERLSVAAVAAWYRPEELEGRLVLAVVNFPPRQIGPARSEALTLGAVQPDGRVALLGVDEWAEPGSRVY